MYYDSVFQVVLSCFNSCKLFGSSFQADLNWCGTTVSVTMGEAGTVQSRKQSCATCTSQVTNRSNEWPCAAQKQKQHTLLEGVAAFCPQWGNSALSHSPRPLALFLLCSALFVPTHLPLWALSAFLPCVCTLGRLSLSSTHMSHASICNFPLWGPPCFLFPPLFLPLCVGFFS